MVLRRDGWTFLTQSTPNRAVNTTEIPQCRTYRRSLMRNLWIEHWDG
jgi:hypothetical protein